VRWLPHVHSLITEHSFPTLAHNYSGYDTITTYISHEEQAARLAIAAQKHTIQYTGEPRMGSKTSGEIEREEEKRREVKGILI